MADDEDEDLYDEEFDFVDDDDEVEEEEDVEEEASADDSDLADEAPPARAPARDRERARGDVDESRDRDDRGEADDAEEPVDEYGRPEPAANYVVHLYEAKKFKRTIDRPFTPEDAEAFASEFNRTGRNYGRFAVTGKNDAKPKKTLD
jgi:hypothetical protein